jgi:hypothetical protein
MESTSNRSHTHNPFASFTAFSVLVIGFGIIGIHIQTKSYPLLFVLDLGLRGL